jgi:hypothetical protein
MTEPVVTITSTSAVAAIAAAFLQIAGVDLPAVIWSAIGAAFMQGHSKQQVSRLRVLVQIVGAALVGGLMGTVLAGMVPAFAGVQHAHIVFLLCAVCGFGAQPLLQTMLSKLVQKIEGGAP